MADMPLTAPAVKPANPNFSSGPCAKRPGWTVDVLADALVGRSHRAKPAKARIEKAIALTPRAARSARRLSHRHRAGVRYGRGRDVRCGALLGARGVDMLAWESFGEGWVTDVQKQLKLADVRVLKARLWRAAGPHAGQFRQRRGVHLERHDLGRARARTPTGSRPTARASRSATRPRRRSRRTSISPSSMW